MKQFWNTLKSEISRVMSFRPRKADLTMTHLTEKFDVVETTPCYARIKISFLEKKW